MFVASLFALAASLSTTSAAALQGFNYGSTFTNGAAKMQSDFQSDFSTAAALVGTSGWTSARLYTMVVSGPLSPVYCSAALLLTAN
jgi:glucan endo-1,3-beta-D-glucosidase